MLSIDSCVDIEAGVRMPLLGLGVYKVPDDGSGEDAIIDALEIGYRHIDTAKVYNNEETVGRAIQRSGVPREDIFLVTKVWMDDMGYTETKAALQTSLDKLQTDYVDLYLIHWPYDAGLVGCWNAMLEAKQEGTARAIGVSNFSEKRLDHFFTHFDKAPAVNQIEMHPFLTRESLRSYCAARNIQMEAYSPLARTEKFGHPGLMAMAEKYSKTSAQIMLRWCLEHRIVTIPKSSNPKRLRENADIFDFSLSETDLATLDALNEDFETTTWRPNLEPFY